MSKNLPKKNWFEYVLLSHKKAQEKVEKLRNDALIESQNNSSTKNSFASSAKGYIEAYDTLAKSKYFLEVRPHKLESLEYQRAKEIGVTKGGVYKNKLSGDILFCKVVDIDDNEGISQAIKDYLLSKLYLVLLPERAPVNNIVHNYGRVEFLSSREIPNSQEIDYSQKQKYTGYGKIIAVTIFMGDEDGSGVSTNLVAVGDTLAKIDHGTGGKSFEASFFPNLKLMAGMCSAGLPFIYKEFLEKLEEIVRFFGEENTIIGDQISSLIRQKDHILKEYDVIVENATLNKIISNINSNKKLCETYLNNINKVAKTHHLEGNEAKLKVMETLGIFAGSKNASDWYGVAEDCNLSVEKVAELSTITLEGQFLPQYIETHLNINIEQILEKFDDSSQIIGANNSQWIL